MELTTADNGRALARVFEYEGTGVRVAGTPEAPLFVAADVCRVLGIGNPSQAMARLDDDERTLISNEGASSGLPAHAVTESGLYSLILGSRKPEARAFKRWITHEVLPAIRRTGGYTVDLSPAEQLLAQAQRLVDQERRQRAITPLFRQRVYVLTISDCSLPSNMRFVVSTSN